MVLVLTVVVKVVVVVISGSGGCDGFCGVVKALSDFVTLQERQNHYKWIFD